MHIDPDGAVHCDPNWHRWYIVCSKYAGDPDDRKARIWTVSRKLLETGWETDSGTPGYGLTYAEAAELSEAANAAWWAKQRDR